MAELNELADGVWTVESPVSFLGMHLTVTMTVLRLARGDLLVHSPVTLRPELRAEVEKLGTASHLYAPNTMHDSWIGEWSQAFPSARVHAPAELAKKRKDLRVDRVHGAPEPAFEGVIDEIAIKGFRLRESELLYRPARTLVVADLVHNIGRPEHWWTAFYSRRMGFYDRVALSRVIRWTAFDDKRAARASIDEVLSQPFDRLVLGHGAPLTSNAREALAAAYTWL